MRIREFRASAALTLRSGMVGRLWLPTVHRCGPLTESANALALRFESATVLGGNPRTMGGELPGFLVSVQVIGDCRWCKRPPAPGVIRAAW